MLGPLFCLSVSLFVTLVYCGQTVDMDQDATGVEVVLGDADPAPTRKGARQPPPTFPPVCIVAKRSPISTTAELLSGLGIIVYSVLL